ncbi:hypothetical protein AB837_00520 [bacterium AB1]|nr:hypothetical protein AB837_00520 [bacterium AB1]
MDWVFVDNRKIASLIDHDFFLYLLIINSRNKEYQEYKAQRDIENNNCLMIIKNQLQEIIGTLSQKTVDANVLKSARHSIQSLNSNVSQYHRNCGYWVIVYKNTVEREMLDLAYFRETRSIAMYFNMLDYKLNVYNLKSLGLYTKKIVESIETPNDPSTYF